MTIVYTFKFKFTSQLVAPRMSLMQTMISSVLSRWLQSSNASGSEQVKIVSHIQDHLFLNNFFHLSELRNQNGNQDGCSPQMPLGRSKSKSFLTKFYISMSICLNWENERSQFEVVTALEGLKFGTGGGGEGSKHTFKVLKC